MVSNARSDYFAAQQQLKANGPHWEGTHCTGKDPFADLAACLCPLLAVELTVDVLAGATRRMRWTCGCCYRLFPQDDRRNPTPPEQRNAPA